MQVECAKEHTVQLLAVCFRNSKLPSCCSPAHTITARQIALLANQGGKGQGQSSALCDVKGLPWSPCDAGLLFNASSIKGCSVHAPLEAARDIRLHQGVAEGSWWLIPTMAHCLLS